LGICPGIDGTPEPACLGAAEAPAAERQALAEHLVEFTAGRGPVFMGVGAESSPQALGICSRIASGPAAMPSWHAADQHRVAESGLVSYSVRWPDGVNDALIVQDVRRMWPGDSLTVYLGSRQLRPGKDSVAQAAPIGPNLSALRDATQGRHASSTVRAAFLD